MVRFPGGLVCVACPCGPVLGGLVDPGGQVGAVALVSRVQQVR